MNLRLANTLGLLARLGFAALLLVAAVPKLRDPAAFAVAIGHYRLLPAPGPAFVAHTLPWLELVIALALIVGRRWLAAAWALAFALFAVFFLAVTSAWWRGLDISCGCFGSGSPINALDVFLRALLVTFAGIALAHARRPKENNLFTTYVAQDPAP